MKKLFSASLVLFLVLSLVSLAHAVVMCGPGEGSVAVGITSTDDVVCAGSSMDIMAKAENTGDCTDFFLVTVGLKYLDPVITEYVPDFVGKSLCMPMLPKLLIPLTEMGPDGGGSFSFTYSGRIPPFVPPGTYILTITAEGRTGGARDTDEFMFTVEDCSSITP
jgi:hypothetical protein